MKSALTRLLHLVLFLLASVLPLVLLPFILLWVGASWLWRTVTGWRYRRAFDARFRSRGKQAVFVYSDSPRWKPTGITGTASRGPLGNKERELFDALDVPVDHRPEVQPVSDPA